MKIGQKIQLLEDMRGCVTEGKRLIREGTIMHHYFSQLTWDYFKDSDGNTLIIMGGAGAPEWRSVRLIQA